MSIESKAMAFEGAYLRSFSVHSYEIWWAHDLTIY